MKVLHVITGLGQGGAESMLVKILKEVGSVPGCTSVVASLTDSGVHGGELDDLGVNVFCLNMRKSIVSIGTAMIRLRRMILTEKPDIVQTWLDHSDVFGGLAAKWGNPSLPVCWNIRHSNPSATHRNLSRRLLGVCHRALSKRLPNIIFVNSRRGLAAHMIVGYSESRMYYIPNAFDVGEFFPDANKGDLFRRSIDSLPTHAMVFGMAARYDPMKDHGTLLKAIRILIQTQRNAFFLLCGTGVSPDNEALSNCITEYGLQHHVALLGPVTTMASFMNALDCHILSSAYGEGFPNVIGEAMACGKPCISTDVGDAAEIVGQTGWIVPPGDPEAMAAAMGEAMREDARSRMTRQENCRQRIVGQYGLSDIAAQYRQLWAQLISPVIP